jgi:hypothetical protein
MEANVDVVNSWTHGLATHTKGIEYTVDWEKKRDGK